MLLKSIGVKLYPLNEEKERYHSILETNVILRFLLKDHEEDYQVVYPLFEKAARGTVSRKS